MRTLVRYHFHNHFLPSRLPKRSIQCFKAIFLNYATSIDQNIIPPSESLLKSRGFRENRDKTVEETTNYVISFN